MKNKLNINIKTFLHGTFQPGISTYFATHILFFFRDTPGKKKNLKAMMNYCKNIYRKHQQQKYKALHPTNLRSFLMTKLLTG